MSDIGNILREARLHKGLSIKEVEGVTKIRGKYLEALEQDDYEVLPGPTFVKAFLRTYATYLKLDADQLVDEYRRSSEPRREESSVLRIDSVPHTRSRVVAERQRRKSRRNQRGYALVVVLALVAVALLAWLGSGWGKQDPASLSSDSVGNVGSTTSLGDVSSTTTPDTANSSTTTSLVVTSGENVVLVVGVTEGSCWLVVREDSESGAELYAGTLAAGGQKTFDGSKRYWMMVGKPEVLALSVNGNSLSLGEEAGSFIVTEAGIESNQ